MWGVKCIKETANLVCNQEFKNQSALMLINEGTGRHAAPPDTSLNAQ